MGYLFLHKGFKESYITFAGLYVNVPAWSMIGWNFRFATVMHYKSSNIWLSAVHKDVLAGWLLSGFISF